MLARIIQTITSREALLALALGALAVMTTPGFAQTTVLSAVADFPIIDAGDAPYYIEPSRGSLAINASNVNYRNVFAQATTQFSGDAGLYDLTLIGLAEIDGEAEYRFSVNGELIGEASNPPSSVDFLPIAHRFNDVSLNSGDTLAVESVANSNDTIPEADGFAFARGRWTELRLTPAGELDSQPEKVSLIGTAASVRSDILVGDTVDVVFAATNEDGDGATATNVRMLFTVPSEMSLAQGHDCTLVPATHSGSTRASCPLQQLSPGESASGQLTLVAESAIENATVNATLIANQQDTDGTDNQVDMEFSITDEAINSATDNATDNVTDNTIDGATNGATDSTLPSDLDSGNDNGTDTSVDASTELPSDQSPDTSVVDSTSELVNEPMNESMNGPESGSTNELANETTNDSNDEDAFEVTNKPIVMNPFESVKDDDELINDATISTGSIGLGSLSALLLFCVVFIRRKVLS